MKNLLFYGELSPNIIHGVSISNTINLNVLKSFFNVDIIEEKSKIRSHNKINIQKSLFFIFSLFRVFTSSISRRYDYYYGIIYLSTFGIFKNIFTIFIFKLFNPRANVILHFHRSDFNIFEKKTINRLAFYFVSLFTDKFIVLSKNQLKYFREDVQAKSYVLNNTIECEYLINEQKNNSTDKHILKLLFIGNFIKEKGIIESIEAVKLLNKNTHLNLSLDLFGSFSNNDIEFDIRSLIKNEHNIKIHDVITGEDKFKIISQYDLLLLPSYNEGLPLTLLESLYLGKPIIISKVGYISDVLGEDYPYYCIPKSSLSVSDNILKFIKNGNSRLLSEKLKSIYDEFSHEKHSKDLLRIFDIIND